MIKDVNYFLQKKKKSAKKLIVIAIIIKKILNNFELQLLNKFNNNKRILLNNK